MKPVIGLTGGIGSGKSTVADMFSALGARIIDTDAISQQLTAPNGKAMALIADVFGPRFIGPTGCLDRSAMRQHVFNDAAARKKLEDILHPLIRTEAGLQLQQLSPAPYCMLVVPLLFESQAYQPLLQRVLVIDCPEALQIERAVARSRLDESMVRRIMAAQCPREQRLARADDVILNDQGLEKLQQRVAGLHAKYIALA